MVVEFSDLVVLAFGDGEPVTSSQMGGDLLPSHLYSWWRSCSVMDSPSESTLIRCDRLLVERQFGST